MSKNIKSSNTSLNRKFADVQFVNKNKKLKDVVFKLIVYVLLFSCSNFEISKRHNFYWKSAKYLVFINIEKYFPV
jgi:hypothetical protein